jgi:serine/threonine protein kinase
MSSTISAVTLLSGLYGRLVLSSPNEASYEPSQESPQDWPSMYSFLSVVTEYGLHQYNQDLFLSGLRSKCFGEGLDYRVDLCEDTAKGSLVAVKHVKLTLPLAAGPGEVESPIIRRFRKVLREIQVMAHPPLRQSKYILNLLGYGWEFAEQADMSPFLVVEYAHLGTLRNFMRSGSIHSWAQKSALCENVSRGIRALHSCGIIHGDVKMENVLIFRTGSEEICAKIADFGSSIIGFGEGGTQSYYGTEDYNAPELRGAETGENEDAAVVANMLWACDIYSYGFLVWETVKNGVQFFTEERVRSAMELKDFKAVREIAVQDCTSNEEIQNHGVISRLRQIVEHTLQPKPSERWTIDSIIQVFEPTKHER